MSSVNKVIILGRLGQDPELKFTPSGAAVCNFSLATSESWQDKTNNQRQERTEWHRVVVWGKIAELCNTYLRKGRQAYVEGSLTTRTWEKDGAKHYMTEIKAEKVVFIGDRSKEESGKGGTGGGASSSKIIDKQYNIESQQAFSADDIPF